MNTKIEWHCAANKFEPPEGRCEITEGPCQLIDCPFRQFRFGKKEKEETKDES